MRWSYVAVAVALAACRDYQFDTPAQPGAEHAPPLANAGTGSTFLVLTTITLDGSASVSPDGDDLSYHWEVITHPLQSSAKIDDPSSAATTFQLDDVGDFEFRLTVTDAEGAKSSTNVTYSSTPPAITLHAEAANNAIGWRESTTFSGTASAEAGISTSIAWALTGRPAGSSAVLVGADTPTPSLFADAEGIYTVTMTAFTPYNSATTTAIVSATAQRVVLPFTAIAADYSVALGRVVAISTSPSTVHLLDLATGADTTIALAQVPSVLSLQPDGLRALVGGPQAVSIVDLQTHKATRTTLSFTVAGVALGTNNIVYLMPNTYPPIPPGIQFGQFKRLDLTTHALTTVSASAWTPSFMRVHPDGDRLYIGNESMQGGGSQAFMRCEIGTSDVTGPAGSNVGAGGVFWFIHGGANILTRFGTVWTTTGSLSTDMATAGSLAVPSLEPIAGVIEAGATLATVSTEGFGSDTDARLDLYDDTSFALQQSIVIPDTPINGTLETNTGVAVTIDPSGTTAYVLVNTQSGSVIYTVPL